MKELPMVAWKESQAWQPMTQPPQAGRCRPAALRRAKTQLEIRLFTASDGQPWDAYVQAHPQGSPFHLTAWKKTMEDIYGYSPRYLLATEGGSIRGVLPLFLVKNLIIGKVLISSPFAVYGGILADTPEIKQAIGEHLTKLGRDLGVQHIELRNAWPEQVLHESNVNR